MTAVGTFRPDAQFREFWQEDPAMQAHPQKGVKEEPPCMSEEVIDLTSSDSASSSDEGSSSSSGSDDDAAPAPVAKARRFAEANAPRADDQWVVRRKSKLLHLARGQSTLELHQRVLQCGRQMPRHFAIALHGMPHVQAQHVGPARWRIPMGKVLTHLCLDEGKRCVSIARQSDMPGFSGSSFACSCSVVHMFVPDA